MSTEIIQLRAHHGMCLIFFEGKGYSDTFTSHMGNILQQMQGNPSLHITTSADIVCEKCPNLENKCCNTSELVLEYDKKVLSFCGLQGDSIIDWNTFSKLVAENILNPGKRSMICGNCEWNDICSSKEKKRGEMK